MPAFADCLGNWRPDFLLTDNEKPSAAPGIGFQICEINSRSPINAILHSAAKHAMMRKMLGSNSILELAGEYDTMANSLLGSFDLNLPIHVVRGRDALERKEFRCLAEKKTGMFPRLVSVSDLQLLPDSSSATGYALYCSRDEPKNGESKVERVHQVLLTLFPEEFGLLSQEMLHHLAKVAVNDFRTILFVNDQRFLGIILQEVDGLVAHHQILTPEEGQILREGIVPTVLPGSPELSKMVASNRDQWENVKDRYILKAARESRGRGHLLGAEVSIAEWNAILLEMQDPSIRADTTSYVLQPYVQQPEFDVVAGEDTTVPGSRIVGTYYSGNGHYIGLGPWRSGSGRICNVFGGSCVLVMSVTTADV